jgi:hypothetical protein
MDKFVSRLGYLSRVYELLSDWSKSVFNLGLQVKCLESLVLEWATVEPPLADTSARATHFSPKLVISIQFNLCIQDTFKLRTAIVSP